MRRRSVVASSSVFRPGVAVIEQHALIAGVDAADGRKQRRHVLASAYEITDRPGDLGGGQRRGRDLIEQRLKQMMVAAVHQRNLHRRTGETEHRFQSAETGADDHDAMRLVRYCRHGAISVGILCVQPMM